MTPSVWAEKRGKVWRVFWQTADPDTRRSQGCGPFKNIADRLVASKRLQLFGDATGLPPSPEMRSWSEFSAEYLAYCRNHKAPNTVTNFEEPTMRSFSRIAKPETIASVTGPLVERWKAAILEAGASPNTVRMRL